MRVRIARERHRSSPERNRAENCEMIPVCLRRDEMPLRYDDERRYMGARKK